MELTTGTGPSVTRQYPPAQAPVGDNQVPGLEALKQAATAKRTTLATFLVGDALACLLVFAITHLTALWVAPSVADQVYRLFIVLVPLFFIAFGVAGFYRPRFVHPALEMKQVALLAAVMGGTATLAVHVATGNPDAVVLVGVAGGVGAIVLPLGRVMTRVLGARLSWWGLPAVIVGSGETGRDVLSTLQTWPEIGLRPVALLDATEGSDDELALGGPDWAPHLAQAFDIPYAVVARPELAHSERAKRLAHYATFFDRVLSVPCAQAPALWTTGQPGDGLHGRSASNAASRPLVQVVKRAFDLVAASLLLLLAAPLFLTIAILIQADSEGSVFYRQERMGADGQIFTLLKFRSMYSDADERLEEVLASDPERREEYETYHKLEDDPRVTPVGEMLRAYSLDELPQLINVVRGDMSLIGPRAYMPSELPKMKGLEKVILQTPPGVTGLWQVSGRNELSFDERVDLDVHYVQNWSMWLDLYLLVRTLPTVVTGEGAA